MPARLRGSGPTSRNTEDPYTFLLRADRPELVAAVREVLDEADVPYRTGLLAAERPSVFFTVPQRYLDHARALLRDRIGARRDEPPAAAAFPWGPVQAVGMVILLHFALVLAMLGPPGTIHGLVRAGALLKGATLAEPWRLLTSLFLHSDPLHAFWNGASMMVFAVPLLLDRGYGPTAAIYFASGIGGGAAALHFAATGTSIIGSSGAVAGLFGAWVVLTLRRARLAALTWHARVRTVGIALLVLPSLMSPISVTGQPISVGSHLGGLASGMAIGALLSTGLARRAGEADVEWPRAEE